MNIESIPVLAFLAVIGLAGCASPQNQTGVTNTRQPGPAVGQAVGTVVGAVAGNVTGAVVGVVEGTAAAAQPSFNNDRRYVRTWRTEVTADGRTVQVPVDIEVDEYGRPIHPPKK